MSDIYLQITETPTVVTLSAPVVSGALASTVTVANTVTVALDSNSLSALENVTVTVGAAITGTVTVSNFPATQPISIASVTIGNTVTIAGTVTANPTGTQTIAGTVTAMAGTNFSDEIYQGILAYANDEGGDGSVPLQVNIGTLPAISGTVTANSGANFDVRVTQGGDPVDGDNAFPISGTVTANASNGSLTTRFGSVTTANTAFATSAVTNANRKYLLIQNVTTASNVITVGVGFTPTTTQGIQLTAGAGLTFEGSYIPTGAINLLSSVTASCFTILEA